MGYEAVIETGGKQYTVNTGDLLRIEKLAGSAGDRVMFDRVLLIRKGDQVHTGTPAVAGATVSAEIVAQERGERLVVYKHKKRTGYRRKNGHRQQLTKVRITGVNA